MYNSRYFQPEHEEEVFAFMSNNPFACLIAVNEKAIATATHIPLLTDKDENGIILSGHVMKGTDHYSALLHNPRALIIFSGADTYVSASWYKDKKQASTWNYMTVHARGSIQFVGEEKLRAVLKRTTDVFEGNPDSGANYTDLEAAYIDKHIKAIAGFEMRVDEWKGTFKLSQNRDAESYQNIISKLQEKGGHAAEIAAEMKRRGK